MRNSAFSSLPTFTTTAWSSTLPCLSNSHLCPFGHLQSTCHLLAGLPHLFSPTAEESCLAKAAANTSHGSCLALCHPHPYRCPQVTFAIFFLLLRRTQLRELLELGEGIANVQEQQEKMAKVSWRWHGHMAAAECRMAKRAEMGRR